MLCVCLFASVRWMTPSELDAGGLAVSLQHEQRDTRCSGYSVGGLDMCTCLMDPPLVRRVPFLRG